MARKPPAFIGGAQPYAPPLGNPVLLGTGVRVDNPPFGQRRIEPALLWYAEPDAFIEIWLPNTIVSVDNPPVFNGPFLDFSVILSTWQPGPPEPQQPRPRLVIGVPVDKPPFDQQGQISILSTILSTWTEAAKFEPFKRPPFSIFPVRVDNPPFTQRTALPNILELWNQEPQRMPPRPPPFTPSGPTIAPSRRGGDPQRKKAKGIMGTGSVPFRRFMYDNSMIYRRSRRRPRND